MWTPASPSPLPSPPLLPPPSPPPLQRQIDPTSRNLWLNDDSSIWVDEDDTISVANLTLPRLSVRSLQIETSDRRDENKRDELLFTLLDVVEQRSGIVLGKKEPSQSPATTPPNNVSPDTAHCQIPTSTSSPTLQTKYTKWTTVPGKPKTATNTPSQNTIEISNMYELLHSVPSSPAKSTSATIPANTWGYSPPSHPQIKRQAQPPATRCNQRPQVVINNKPEADNPAWRKTSPGNSSFAAAVKDGRKVAIFSDSICNRMSKYELRKKLKCNITKKAFPGATTDDMYEHYMWPTLKKNTPDTAIIHIGVNDILAKGTPDGGLTSISIEQIAKDVIRCGEACESVGVNTICFSSVLPFKGRRAQSTTNHINDQLAKLWGTNHMILSLMTISNMIRIAHYIMGMAYI